jgi:hypothetical protein
MPTASTPPVRGTQTFVGVMSAVWGRPSLAGLEIAWRWLPGILAAALVALLAGTHHAFGIATQLTPQLTSDLAAVQAATVFQPVAGVHTLVVAWSDLLTPLWPLLRWLLPTLFVLWNLLAAFGRTAVLRRFDPTLAPRRGTLFVLGLLRSLLLAGAWCLWAQCMLWAVRSTITGPAAHGQEPDIVALSALWICGTLALYVAWGIVSWFLYLAPLVAMRHKLGPAAALRTALCAGPVRGKLIEINLVMHIVKLTLIVLAMVWSASPLAFQSVATQEFFALWWAMAVLLYFAASDYFHVVRSAAYLRLWHAYAGHD